MSAREIADTYVLDAVKLSWHIDLLNIRLNDLDLQTANERICRYVEEFKKDRARITENLDFEAATVG